MVDQDGCSCETLLRHAETGLKSGLPFEKCFDALAEVLRCAGTGPCRERVGVSDRAGAMVIRLLKRG